MKKKKKLQALCLGAFFVGASIFSVNLNLSTAEAEGSGGSGTVRDSSCNYDGCSYKKYHSCAPSTPVGCVYKANTYF